MNIQSNIYQVNEMKNEKHLFFYGFVFFLINSTQLEQNKKIHQHTTEVTVVYHKI